MIDRLKEMITALDLEIHAVRDRSRGRQVHLRGGERVGEAGDYSLYRFILMEDPALPDDTPIRVSIGVDDIAGSIVRAAEGVIVIALEKNVGERIASARLVANDSYLIERLRERLDAVCKGEASMCGNTIEKLLGLSPVCSADGEPDPLVLQDGEANDDQVRAVRRSLNTDVLYLWGPPGTGKTSTLARIVEAHYRAGRSVLLVSNTNIAVDTATERIAERLKGVPEFYSGLLIRQGPAQKDELKKRFGNQVLLSQVADRLSESTRTEKAELARQLGDIEESLANLESLLRMVEELEQRRRHLSLRENAMEELITRSNRYRADAERYREVQSAKSRELVRVRGMGVIRRFLSGLDPLRIEEELKHAAKYADGHEQAAEALSADVSRAKADVTRLREDTNRLVEDTRHLPAHADLVAQLNAKRSAASDLRIRKAALEQELTAIEDSLLERCRILATTVYRIYLGKSPSRTFDTVVVDEASMLIPPLVVYAAGLATKSLIVAGDFRQLPPIVASEDSLAVKTLKRDVFELAKIPERLGDSPPPQELVSLSVQYRMREPICSVINEMFYADRPLSTAPSTAYASRGCALGPQELLYFDTSAFHPWSAMRVGTYSRYNIFHALLVRSLVMVLDKAQEGASETELTAEVGAVAPYASQAQLINALLVERLGDRAKGIAATVHRFQGNEKQTMLVDLTDSIGTPVSRFLKAIRPDEEGARLLNVAMSRAKEQVVLIANFEHLRTKVHPGGIVRRLMERFKKHGSPLDVSSLAPVGEQEWIEGLQRVTPIAFDLPSGGHAAFTEGTFYPAFHADILAARESIVIFSPFVTSPGTARWIDACRLAILRGVRIRIVAKPPEEAGGGNREEVVELVRRLRELGVAVDLRFRMHEKIAIVDDRVLWHGSLNILSHRDTHESMLRIESAAACSQLSRLISTPGPRDAVPDSATAENPTCPKCSGSMVWRNGQYGIYYTCEGANCDGKVNANQFRRMQKGPARTGGGTDQ